MTVTFKNFPKGTGASAAAAAETESGDAPGTNAEIPQEPTAKVPYGQNDLFREITVVWVLVNLIDDNTRRVRRALRRQELDVLQAVKRFGFRIPILVRTKPGGERYEVIDGHARLAAAQMLEAEKIPCMLVDDLPDTEVRRLVLSLNRLQERGEWDEGALKLEINELIEITGDFEIAGFEMPEIEAIHFGGGDAGETDPSDDPAYYRSSAGPPVSRPGDLWQLGDHRLLCGSARNHAGIAETIGEELVEAVFTDPPYNVRISGNARSAESGFEEFAEASGEMTSTEFVAFLEESLRHAAQHLRPGGVMFACMDWRHVGEMTVALETLGLEALNICVWVKSNPGMGSLYRSQHEFVFVARKAGAKHTNNVQLGQYGRNRSNVWHYAGATGGRTDADDTFVDHPTVKPIRMVIDALLDVTGQGDLVLDPFLGSGTTLLAAERTRRRCIGVEIAPRYVDLAIRRWQEMTGGQAVHAETGQTFDMLVAEQGDAEEADIRGRDRDRSDESSTSRWEEF